MNKSPFYNILLKDTQEDVTEFIVNFTFEETVDKDDLLRLQVVKVRAVELIESEKFKIGQELVFTFGYIGGKQSGKRLARITGNKPSYGQQVKYEIIATDLGLLLKKGERNDDWSGRTSSEIARQIARRNGMETNIEETSKSHELMLQGGKTDFEFLKYLADIEGNGYRFYISGQILNFTKRDLLKKSSRSFDYSEGKDWIKFDVTEMDNTKDTGSKEVEFRGTNPLTGETANATISTETSKEGKLGAFSVHFNERGEEQFTKPSVAAKAKKSTAKKKMIGSTSETTIKGRADTKQRKAALNDMKGTLSIIMTPDLRSDEIITLEGIPQVHAGNWYVKAVTHNISSGGASTALALNKNATNKDTQAGGNSKNDNSKQNKTTGEREGNDRKELVIINADGDVIAELEG